MTEWTDGYRAALADTARLSQRRGFASALIAEADTIADARWPGERHYTYVNPRKIRSCNPGACFKAAGWRRCGETKWNRLVILAREARAA